MILARLTLVCAFFVLVGCGKSKPLTCDEGPYQTAVRAPKVQSPEGLDSLNALNEVPLPAASPQQPAPADGSCLEHPPQIIRME